MTIACPDCGTLQDLPPLGVRSAAICPTCGHHLERTSGRSQNAALACASGTFFLLIPANLLPLMSVSIFGMTRETRMASGVAALWLEHWVVTAVFVAAFAIVLPLIRFGLLSVVLLYLRLSYRPAWLGRAFRWASLLDAWAMPDVFLVGCLVGYSRVEARLSVSIGPGGLCLLAAAFLSMISRAVLDRRSVWRALMPELPAPSAEKAVISCTICDLVVAGGDGLRCPRCGAHLTSRRTDALTRTAALLLAGLMLYFPANLLPMSMHMAIGQEEQHRIVDGIIDLFQAGLAPLGVLIFCTSVLIPLLKLVGLSWFLVSIRRKSASRLVLKTKLYRVIDEIGRWSNIDVFTVAVFVPLMHFGPLVTTAAGGGSTAFVLVVVLTMIASRAFDPRLMWDAALAGAR